MAADYPRAEGVNARIPRQPGATRAKVPTIGVLSGGFSREQLEETGAVAVFESIAELRRDLESTSLG